MRFRLRVYSKIEEGEGKQSEEGILGQGNSKPRGSEKGSRARPWTVVSSVLPECVAQSSTKVTNDIAIKMAELCPVKVFELYSEGGKDENLNAKCVQMWEAGYGGVRLGTCFQSLGLQADHNLIFQGDCVSLHHLC